MQVSIYEDGTAMWRMEKRKPKHDLSVKHETPPNDLREVSVTTIDQSGMGSFYDSKDALLFKHQVPISSFKNVVANIKENPNVIFAVMGVKTAENATLMLAHAKAKGYIINDLGNNLVSVRSGNGKDAANLARKNGEADNFTTVDIFNTALGILIGSTMYDEQENIVSQSFYKYVLNSENQLVPEAIFTQSWDKDPVTGNERKVDTNIYFENVTATININ